MQQNNLLFIKSENARFKIKEMAYLFNKSSQRLKYNLKILEKEQILFNPYCIFDYSYFGLLLFRVYFKSAYINEKEKIKIIQELIKNEYVVAIYELEGEYDLVIEIEAPNPSRFNKTIKNISELIPELSNYKTILNLVTHIYPRKYLPEEKLLALVPNEIILGGDRPVDHFDSQELIVIENLLSRPLLRASFLAKLCRLNVKTTTKVLSNLKERRILKGFKYLLNQPKLGINHFRLFLKLHNLTKERENELREYCLKTKEITQIHKTLGDWDLEIDLEAFNKTRIRLVTIDIREQFKDLIENFNMIEFYQQYSRRYLPLYLFSLKEQN